MKESEKILGILEENYREARTALNFGNPFELLIATILSAQCTDRQVNKITEKLFAKYQGPADFARLTPEELAEEIKGCGLFRTKSKNIIATCKILIEKYHGQVPDQFDDLVQLPGVGRKTANVVLSNAFHQDALAVDTHVFRVANRLGLAQSDRILGTEKDLTRVIPRSKWSAAHHWLIYHGRLVCRARKPGCQSCCVADFCPSREKFLGAK